MKSYNNFEESYNNLTKDLVKRQHRNFGGSQSDEEVSPNWTPTEKLGLWIGVGLFVLMIISAAISSADIFDNSKAAMASAEEMIASRVEEPKEKASEELAVAEPEPDATATEASSTDEVGGGYPQGRMHGNFSGKYPFTINLTITESGDINVNGTLYYDKYGPSNSLSISGYTDGDMIYFTEYADNGSVGGSYSLRNCGDHYEGRFEAGSTTRNVYIGY